MEPEDETENGSSTVKKVQHPREPSREERAQHEMTHWCGHWLRLRLGRCPGNEHERGAFGLLVLVSRRGFSADDGCARGQGKNVPDDHERCCARKTTGTYIAKRVVGSLREIGGLHGDVVVKSDQEPALRSIVEDVARVNGTDGGRYVVKCSPVGARLSNGMVERAMQSVSGQTSVLLSTMVWGRSIPYDHPWMCHIVGYAGVLQRFEVGRSDDPWHWHRRGGAVVEDHLGS